MQYIALISPTAVLAERCCKISQERFKVQSMKNENYKYTCNGVLLGFSKSRESYEYQSLHDKPIIDIDTLIHLRLWYSVCPFNIRVMCG